MRQGIYRGDFATQKSPLDKIREEHRLNGFFSLFAGEEFIDPVPQLLNFSTTQPFNFPLLPLCQAISLFISPHIQQFK